MGFTSEVIPESQREGGSMHQSVHRKHQNELCSSVNTGVVQILFHHDPLRDYV